MEEAITLEHRGRTIVSRERLAFEQFNLYFRWNRSFLTAFQTRAWDRGISMLQAVALASTCFPCVVLTEMPLCVVLNVLSQDLRPLIADP